MHCDSLSLFIPLILLLKFIIIIIIIDFLRNFKPSEEKKNKGTKAQRPGEKPSCPVQQAVLVPTPAEGRCQLEASPGVLSHSSYLEVCALFDAGEVSWHGLVQ